MVIQAHNLCFQYDRKTPLIQNVSLTIAAGECIAIFGPNGGGKTTFLKLLMGFLKPTSGSLCIGGKTPAENRQSMGYVPQINQLDRQFPITVLEVVKMGALSSSLFDSTQHLEHQALQHLDQVGLKDLASTSFGSLSGGQVQRVLIARARMGNRNYLFLDEATSNIDPSGKEHFHASMKKFKGGPTIVMVTHDLPTVVSYIDRFFCVYGEITPYSPKQICDHFAHGLYHPPLQRNS